MYIFRDDSREKDSQAGGTALNTPASRLVCPTINMPLSDYQPDNNNRPACVLGADIHTETSQSPETAGFQENPQWIEDMQDHLLMIMNPERYYYNPPLDKEIKEAAIKEAEDFLVRDGFKLIDKQGPDMFQGA